MSNSHKAIITTCTDCGVKHISKLDGKVCIHKCYVMNIMDYVKYKKCEVNDDMIYFLWDYNNPKLDSFMEREYRNRIADKKKSLMWIEIIKKEAGWVKGETLYLNTKSNCDGAFMCEYSRNKSVYDDIIIEPSGFAVMNTFNYYNLNTNKDDGITSTFYIRVDSIYNDNVYADIKGINK